ncbi:nucleoid-associated protein [Sphingobacterium sp. T2]|uniref:nucleoid-associated protein n=1 Tax=Sphingobacterium sp. T2 TaxID=1590596 RepID=UPI0029351BFE|nr:nucleoid-associated protein [Sphingobacterium sp. T2]
MRLLFFHQDASFKHISIHHVGNKANDEFYILSESPLDLSGDEVLPDLLMQYFMKPFGKLTEVYRFYHPNDELELNEVYYFSKQYFSGEIDFHTYSQQVTKHLYEVSDHPKIKSGEVYVVALRMCRWKEKNTMLWAFSNRKTKRLILKCIRSREAFS